MINRISSPSPTGSGIPAHIIPSMNNYFNKNKIIFQLERSVVLHYVAKRWWQSMTMVTEKRKSKSVKYG